MGLIPVERLQRDDWLAGGAVIDGAPDRLCRAIELGLSAAVARLGAERGHEHERAGAEGMRLLEAGAQVVAGLASDGLALVGAITLGVAEPDPTHGRHAEAARLHTFPRRADVELEIGRAHV